MKEAIKMTRHLTLSPEAIAKIKPQLTEHARILLSYDDGVGPYSHHGLVALQVSFQLVLINDSQPYDDYDEEIETNLQPMYIKSYSGRFLSDQMTLKLQPKYQTLVLADEGGEIDQNVEVVSERN